MKYKNEKMRAMFTTSVQKYKSSMQYTGEEKSKIRRAFHNVCTFGLPYILYTITRLRIPILYGNILVTLFFGRRLTLPIDDIGSHVLSLYGIIPHGSERKLTEWMMNNLEKTDVFYDVGAHLGFYTALAGEMSEVHSFEANTKLCKYLRKNFKNITCKAVTSSSEEVDFYDATQTSDSSESSRFNISGVHLRVPAITLDEYVQRGNRPPTVIKFDIEGGEYDAIMGASALIQKYKPRIILEVWGGEMGRKYSDNAVKKLYEFGYEAFSFERDGTLSQISIPDPVGSINDGPHNPRDNFMFVYKEIASIEV